MTNPERASGGTEEETDDELRQRILEANDMMDTSYIGNHADYKRWAESVQGIEPLLWCRNGMAQKR